MPVTVLIINLSDYKQMKNKLFVCPGQIPKAIKWAFHYLSQEAFYIAMNVNTCNTKNCTQYI